MCIWFREYMMNTVRNMTPVVLAPSSDCWCDRCSYLSWHVHVCGKKIKWRKIKVLKCIMSVFYGNEKCEIYCCSQEVYAWGSVKCSFMFCPLYSCLHFAVVIFCKKMYWTTIALWSLYRSACFSRHPQLVNSWWICWSKDAATDGS